MAGRGELDGSDRGALDRVRRAMSSVEAAAVGGLVAATLMMLSIYLIEHQPGVGTAGRDLSWYADPDNRSTVKLGLDLGVVGMIAFFGFMAVIRRRLADREDKFYATVFLGSGIAFALLATTAAVCAAAPTLVVHFGGEESLSDSTLALAQGLWFGFWGIGASRFAGVFMAVTSILGRRFGALPTWLSYFGSVLGLLLLFTGAFAGPLYFLFPAWLALVSITLLVSGRDRSARSDS